jgi:outer membrane biosynthesis protein TonB
MSTFLKFCLVSLLAGWTVPGTNFARATQTSPQQTTPTPSTDAEKSQRPQTKSAKPLPNPDASGKYHVGDGVTPPRLLLSVEPDFPEAAKTARVRSANCVLAITINTDGNVRDANVVSSKPTLDDQKFQAVATAIRDSCVKAIQQFRFKPATFQGKPVPVEMKIQVNIDAF